jgi:hypothetical protein
MTEPTLHIAVSTDSSVTGSDGLTAHVQEVVSAALQNTGARITRVEVHLSDTNAGKGGSDDKRCMMEARLQGRQPTAVTHEAATVEQAVKGAADKLKRALESIVGRLGLDR